MQFTAEELYAITTTCTRMGNKMSASLGFASQTEVAIPSQLRHTRIRMRRCSMLFEME